MSRRHSIFTLWRNYFRRTVRLLGPRPRRVDIAEMRSARRIILEKRDNIGDFILCTTFLNEVHVRWTDRDVTLVCTAPVEPLARLLYPKWRIQVTTLANTKDDYQGSWRSPGPLQREVRSWPEADLLVNLRSIRHNSEMIFTSWIPARAKLGVSNRFCYETGQFIKIPDSRVYSQVLPAACEPTLDACRELQNFRTLLSGLLPATDTAKAWPRIDFGQAGALYASNAEAKGAMMQECLVLVPFPSGAIRRYPLDKLAEVASSLAAKYGLNIGIVGSERDREEASLLVKSLSAPGGVRNLAGVLSLPELVETVRKSRLVLGVDTGPVHVGIACDVPTVVILGGGHYGTFGPWGNPDRAQWLTHQMPCFDCNWACTQEEPYCIKRVTTDEVFKAAEKVLSRKAHS